MTSLGRNSTRLLLTVNTFKKRYWCSKTCLAFFTGYCLCICKKRMVPVKPVFVKPWNPNFNVFSKNVVHSLFFTSVQKFSPPSSDVQHLDKSAKFELHNRFPRKLLNFKEMVVKFKEN